MFNLSEITDFLRVLRNLCSISLVNFERNCHRKHSLDILYHLHISGCIFFSRVVSFHRGVRGDREHLQGEGYVPAV